MATAYRLPPYDIELDGGARQRLALRSLWRRIILSPYRHWQRTPAEFAAFRRFVRDQVLCYSPRYFRPVRLAADPAAQALLQSGQPAVYAFIHHGYFPAIAFALRRHGLAAVTTIGTSPRRNLAPAVNPDHEYWKFAFYHQARRYLGQRFIFSDEPPVLALDWLTQGGSLTIAIDVSEEGQTRKRRGAIVAGRHLALPETVTRLARLARCPVVAASLYREPAGPVLKLGAPRRVESPQAASAIFQTLCEELFQPFLQYPEQRFFDIMQAFEDERHGATVSHAAA